MAKPVHEIRVRSILGRIYRKKTRLSVVRHSVSFVRLYRNGSDGWSQSTRMATSQLPILALVAQQAHLWILQNSQPQSESSDSKASAVSTTTCRDATMEFRS
jgi:hypothetical protein